MRAFIAVNLPDQVKREIESITGRLRTVGPPARWVPGHNLHLTIKFLDEIRDTQVQPIRDAITTASAGVVPFDIRLGGFGVFPSERKARVFWVGVDSGYEHLKKLARSIDREVTRLGFPAEERPFSAHITLARFRDPCPADQLMRMAEQSPCQSKDFRVEQVDLMKSILGHGSPEYSVVQAIPLLSNLAKS